jgi:hypothetical protein
MILEDNIDTIKKNTNDASKEVGIEVYAEKTKYMLMSCEEVLFHVLVLHSINEYIGCLSLDKVLDPSSIQLVTPLLIFILFHSSNFPFVFSLLRF